MCIICAKLQGVSKPTTETIKTMAQNNPDGCGIMYAKGGKLYVVKTMNVKNIIRINDKEIDDNTPAVYHFRIATHGSVRKSNCHPFVDKGIKTGFMHNGILSIANEGDWTDSETAFRRLFVPIIRKCGLTHKSLDYAVNAVIGGSKFVFLRADGTCRMFGQFITEKDGLLYSNSTYQDFHTAFEQYHLGMQDCDYPADIDCLLQRNKNEQYYEALNSIEFEFQYDDPAQVDAEDLYELYRDIFPDLTLKDYEGILWTLQYNNGLRI